jgi:phosphoribosylamine--glycine ligase/phosphoribosylformylglycinamidine cyclo-ligase
LGHRPGNVFIYFETLELFPVIVLFITDFSLRSIIAVPGNGGTATCAKTTNNTEVSADDFPGLVALAQKNKVNLVVPGPEQPLVDGIADFFKAVAIPVYGPSKLAARMEGSKTFSKDFMKKHNIPTAAYENFSDYKEALQHLEKINYNVVIKASGLAAGKGVILPATKEEAQIALKEIMLDREFGSGNNLFPCFISLGSRSNI